MGFWYSHITAYVVWTLLWQADWKNSHKLSNNKTTWSRISKKCKTLQLLKREISFQLSGKFLCSDNPLRVTSPKPGANWSFYVIPRDKLMFDVNTGHWNEWLFHQHLKKKFRFSLHTSELALNFISFPKNSHWSLNNPHLFPSPLYPLVTNKQLHLQVFCKE